MKYSIFTHPNYVCMSYVEHMKFSMSLGNDLAIGSIKAYIHAIFPNLFITSSSDLSQDLASKLQNSGCRKD